MQVTLHGSFSKQLNELANALDEWADDAEAELLGAHERIGARHKQEAAKRVPVDEGRLRNGIITKTHREGEGFLTETGTNVREYPVYLEFGTKYIAGGRVKALGDSPTITDAQAIKDWPAKAEDNARREQMPWLRPAFSAILDWALKQFEDAITPPKQKR